MRTYGVTCDWKGCVAMVRVEESKRAGWVTIGGGKRGKARVDLCPKHAKAVDRLLAKRGYRLPRSRRARKE